MTNSKRYNSINNWLKRQFGERVYKISLDAGLGCPNRDGTVGRDGCSFCNLSAYVPATSLEIKPASDIERQVGEGIEYLTKRHGASRFISYFQSGSNTHARASDLRDVFLAALNNPSIVGLAVSTRPDCIDDEVTELLADLSKKTFLWMELGLQSSNDRTLKLIERGHDSRCFRNAAKLLQAKNIPVCAHMIIGLPGETREDIINTAHFLNETRVWGVKIHNLHILKDTQLEIIYNDGKVKVLSLKEYASLVADFLERLNPDTIIHRLNSHSPRRITVAPEWSINKLAIFSEVEQELDRRDTYQGREFKKNNGA